MTPDSQRDWCCSFFEDGVMRRGQGGIAIAIASDENVGLGFIMESRAVNLGDEKQIRYQGDAKVYAKTAQGIKFCPWCGTSLQDFYASKRSVLPVHDKGL
jgi:hypothetical protein